MIDTIIFDLDGVLIDSKNIHFNALNKAIKKCNLSYQISHEDHLKKYDGLPTIRKLQILNDEGFINKKFNKKIQIYKDKFTLIELSRNIKFSKNIYEIFKKLSKNYKLAIATNAVSKTLDLCIKKFKIKKFLKSKLSNKSVKNAKPHPEIYLRSILNLNSNPKNTLIVEDSHFGRSAAKDSGSNLMPVKSTKEVTYKNIINFIKFPNNLSFSKSNVWDDKDLNIVIPMAGEGSRFKDAGYTFPKPLVEVWQKPMIQLVIENLGLKGNFIFLVRREHLEKYNLKSFLNVIAPGCKIVIVDHLTQGAACTVLLAKNYINNNKPLIISNSDQFIEWNTSEIMYHFSSKKIDGGILTFKNTHPKWSYARVNNYNKVIEVAEKKVISNNATVGVYFWKKGRHFVRYANQMIKKNIRVNNEFYVCPVYNEAIADKKNIIIKNVQSMWGIGTPEDLEFFINNYKKNY
jgi:HAD superfamily hydrolase (TIGR01509 family)